MALYNTTNIEQFYLNQFLGYMWIDIHPAEFRFEDKYGCIGNINNSRVMNLFMDEIHDNNTKAFNNPNFCEHYRTFLENKLIADLETEETMDKKQQSLKQLKDYTHWKDENKIVMQQMKFHPRHIERMLNEFGEDAFNIILSNDLIV